MHLLRTGSLGALFYLMICSSFAFSQEAKQGDIPLFLQDWVNWVLWDEPSPETPRNYSQPGERITVWSTGLKLNASERGADFSLEIKAFKDGWVALPGGGEEWPKDVLVSGVAHPVVGKNGVPHIEVKTGEYQVQGVFQWPNMPQKLLIPRSVGVLELVKNRELVHFPSWAKDGNLWLTRSTKGETTVDFLSKEVYRNLRDGAPMWLSTEVDLTVTGRSREVVIGGVMPEGWQISSVQSQIPCAVDERGVLKSQVRAGKWTVSISAFKTTPALSMSYAGGVTPAVTEELISLQHAPEFRLIEFTNVLAVDSAQTTFPDKWKQFPVHLWGTEKPFLIEERMRGMGQKKLPGISIERSFWLDNDGRNLTYRDEINGRGLQTWRLDAAEGQQLGAAKVDGQSQLITKNPVTGDVGVEIRVRDLNLQSVGRMAFSDEISATGWKKNAETLSGRLFLPPGWRALAIIGPDVSKGDWVAAWSLLDVFLLLIFTVAIARLWSVKVGVLAFFAFIVSYHEPGLPRLLWLLVILAAALYRAIGHWKVNQMALVASYLAIFAVSVALVPFVFTQIQQAIYPQLEEHSVVGTTTYGGGLGQSYTYANDDPFATDSRPSRSNTSLLRSVAKKGGEGYAKKNLKYDSKAKIQTGPAVPEWSWRSVTFKWSGPVSENETVSFILIPRWLQRLIFVLRVVLLIGLLYYLVRGLKHSVRSGRMLATGATSVIGSLAMLGCLFGTTSTGYAEEPSPQLLEVLKERVSSADFAGYNLAEIPEVDLTITEGALSMDVVVHALSAVAVPLPGQLPTWSPLKVVDSFGSSVPVMRKGGYLWVTVSAGTHELRVTGLVPASDWEWSFLLKPKYVNIDAKGWAVTGVNGKGVPEDQVFFVEQNRSEESEAAYDRKDFNPIFKVERSLELGLLWQSTTTVKRLSPVGKAVSVSLPLLPGERVLSPGFVAKEGRLEIRLGAQQKTISWESQLEKTPEISLECELNDHWVEEWQVIASSVWNLEMSGLAPIFQSAGGEMVPMWKPWPGEGVALMVAKPVAIEGETLTINQAIHKMDLGGRQRSSSLKLSLQNSLGMDFILSLGKDAEVSSLVLNGRETPVRREGESVIIPLRPGKQTVKLSWKSPVGYSFMTKGDHVVLPVNCANTSTIMTLSPDSRWLLWAGGPLRGPAVRFWPILIGVILLGCILGKVPNTPLTSSQWVLFLIGLTQVPMVAMCLAVLWLFWVSFKSLSHVQQLPTKVYNLNQFLIVGGVLPFLGILLYALNIGLLGDPEMSVMGESSSEGNLRWFQPRGAGQILPIPQVLSVNIWFYRGLMLLWSVWLAFSVLKWMKWGYAQLTKGGVWQRKAKKAEVEE